MAVSGCISGGVAGLGIGDVRIRRGEVEPRRTAPMPFLRAILAAFIIGGAILLAQDSPTVDEACPYPAAAEESGDTGTVVLLVYIAADGRPTKAEVESSSDSKLLGVSFQAHLRAIGFRT